jgi:cell shape-determining protein MreC
MDSARRKKWLGIATRYPSMTSLEQQRIQSQMRDWAALTPDQRKQVRDKYKNIKQLPPEKHEKIKHKWREYEQLREEQKKAASSLDNVPD